MIEVARKNLPRKGVKATLTFILGFASRRLVLSPEELMYRSGTQFETVASFLTQPLAILTFAAFTLLFGPLLEELSWRGYALDWLQAKWNALASSLDLQQ